MNNLFKQNYRDIYKKEIRISCTARERLFTIGLSYYIYDLFGGHDAKVSVVNIITKSGIRIKIKKDPNGSQKLRSINHKEVGLRINSKQDNPVDFPFKSFRLIADVLDEEQKIVEFLVPLTKLKEVKPRNHYW